MFRRCHLRSLLRFVAKPLFVLLLVGGLYKVTHNDGVQIKSEVDVGRIFDNIENTLKSVDLGASVDLISENQRLNLDIVKQLIGYTFQNTCTILSNHWTKQHTTQVQKAASSH